MVEVPIALLEPMVAVFVWLGVVIASEQVVGMVNVMEAVPVSAAELTGAARTLPEMAVRPISAPSVMVDFLFEFIFSFLILIWLPANCFYVVGAVALAG